MNKQVSVLMCVYNTDPEYLLESVNSILTQTYDNLEVIIVNDGSDLQDTIDCLRSISKSDSRIVLIHNNRNMGLTYSLNIGLQICSGDYIARMDADDISVSDRIEKQVRYMENNYHIALVGSYITCFGEKIDKPYIQAPDFHAGDRQTYRIRALFEHPGPAHPTFMLRRQFLEDNEIKYDTRILKAQDYNLITKILQRNGEIDVIEEPLLKYRVHKGQISSISEIEQLIYRSKTSFEYLHEVFPFLEYAECAAVSTLGWYDDGKVYRYATADNNSYDMACDYLFTYRRFLSEPTTYIRALKKIFNYNKKRKCFNQSILVQELSFRWWKKAIRMSKEFHRIWGFSFFTIRCYLFAVVGRNRD